MKIYSLIITDVATGVAPIYEVHSWEKVEEIIRSTMELTKNEFIFEVVGRANSKSVNCLWLISLILLVVLFVWVNQ